MLSSEIIGVCRDSIISIATRYGLVDLEIESRYGRDLPHPSISALGVHPVKWVPGLFPAVKRPGLRYTSFLGSGGQRHNSTFVGFLG